MSEQVSEIVVVAMARTPFGRFEGALKNIVALRPGALAVNTRTASSL
jgi:acetyl-CoA acetyltransferase